MLFVRRHGAARGEGFVRRGKRQRAAMDPEEAAIGGHFAQVAADGVFGDGEVGCSLGRDDLAVGGEAFGEERAAVGCQHDLPGGPARVAGRGWRGAGECGWTELRRERIRMCGSRGSAGCRSGSTWPRSLTRSEHARPWRGPAPEPPGYFRAENGRLGLCLPQRVFAASHACQRALLPLKVLRSTSPGMPGTAPVALYCQNVQGRPP